MKESNDKEGNIARVWTFEEWKEGNSPVNFHTLLTDISGKKWRNVISNTDYQKLRKEQKMHYREAVQKSFDREKESWKRKLQRTKDAESLKSKEVASVERLIKKPSLHSVRSSYEYWREYDLVITDGKDGSLFHHPYHSNYHPNAIRYIEVEAKKMFLDFLIEYVPKKPETETLSYQWQGNSGEDLPELFELLKDTHKLIHSDTTLIQFEHIFTGKPLNEITPVKWHNDFSSEVLFLLMEFMKRNAIPNESRMKYKKIEGCFVNSSGQPFNCNWKNIKQGIEHTLAQEKQDLLRSIALEF